MLLPLALLLAAQEGALPPEFTRFQLARERVGHRVVAEGVLSAPADVECRGLRLVFVFFSGERELKRSKPLDHAGLAPGQAWTFKAEAEQVENFDRYEAWLDISGRRSLYESGKDLGAPPQPRKNPPAKAVVAAASDERPAAFPGDVAVRLVVRNDAPGAAREPVATFLLQSPSGEPLQALRVPLGAPVDAWSEDTWQILLPQCPNYARFECSLAWLDSEIPGLGNPASAAKDLGISRCRVMRLSDGSVRLSGSLRNGRAEAVDRVRIDFQVGGRSAAHAVEGALAPGAARDFDVYLGGVAKLDGASFSLAYEEVAAAKPALEPQRPFARRTGFRRLEPPAVPVPVPAAAQEVAAPKPPALTAELRGVMLVEGLSVKNFNKTEYTGDVLFAKLAFRDAEGKPAQPLGVLSASIATSTERLAAVSRNVKKESWKTDAARIGPSTASPELVAFDAKTGELWIGLVRASRDLPELRLDLSFRVAGVGLWEWKKLEKPFEAAARPPDKK